MSFKRRMNEFVWFKDLIPKALAHYQLERQARAALVCSRFRDLVPGIVGKDAEGVVKAKYVKGGVLYVAVPSSVWAQRVYVHRHELLTRINLESEKPLVDDLRTYVE